MKIVIDNPCHENWDAMSPNERGAFCSACQKTVIDFSKKTVDEIKNFFVELPQTEKVCGRFDEEQLDEINFESFFHQFSKWSYFRKAAIITFFIFGFGLFGHAQSNNNRHVGLKGEVAVVMPPDTGRVKIKKDTAKTIEQINLRNAIDGLNYKTDSKFINDLSDHAILISDPKVERTKEKVMGKPAIDRNPH